MSWLSIIIGIVSMAAIVLCWNHQRRLRRCAHLLQEAIHNRDYTFRLSDRGLFPGERALQQTLNQLGETVLHQVSQSEVKSWEQLTRMLTHETMNATAPITSISQSLLRRSDVKDTPLEAGIQAIHDSSRHLSEFVINYRKMSELENPIISKVHLHPLIDDVSRAYPQLTWEIEVPTDITVSADAGMLRQVMVNLVKNAIEAEARKMTVAIAGSHAKEWNRPVILYIGNDGNPIPTENRQSLFVPFFTTKHNGSGIGLSLSRRMMVLQGGMLELADTPLRGGCHAAFLLTLASPSA